MPFKGIIAVLLIAVAVTFTCWEELSEFLPQWFDEEE